MMDKTYFITVEFAPGFEGIDKGPFLLEMERMARRMLGVRAEVFMNRKGDDSKLRTLMTPEERKTL